MEKSTVYFTDFRCKVGTSQLDKLKKLCIAAGIKNIDMDGKFVAIKMHFGELGNLAFLRPNYAKVVADLCKELGGMPFLTDCNTLYPGSRKNALEHMDCANLNGFNTVTTGCQIIIGDGLRGTDDVEVPVENAEYCPTAKIGRAVMDADVFISLTRDMRQPVLAAQLRTSEWAAEAVREKWLSTPAVSQSSMKSCAVAVNAVPRNAEVTQLHILRKKLLSIMINVRAVVAASVPAALMPSTIHTAIPMSSFAAR